MKAYVANDKFFYIKYASAMVNRVVFNIWGALSFLSSFNMHYSSEKSSNSREVS